ncbi:MAG: 30S ribosomal protein S20 [Actinomycetota bacterium]|nr:30S ribosomal protein S20 [Actinomycetota bacterium]
MANIKSQIKRNRQNERRRVRNRGERSALRTKSRRFNEALASDDSQAAQDAYRDAARALDRAASKGIIHKNRAADKKSRLARKLNSGAA